MTTRTTDNELRLSAAHEKNLWIFCAAPCLSISVCFLLCPQSVYLRSNPYLSICVASQERRGCLLSAQYASAKRGGESARLGSDTAFVLGSFFALPSTTSRMSTCKKKLTVVVVNKTDARLSLYFFFSPQKKKIPVEKRKHRRIISFVSWSDITVSRSLTAAHAWLLLYGFLLITTLYQTCLMTNIRQDTSTMIVK